MLTTTSACLVLARQSLAFAMFEAVLVGTLARSTTLLDGLGSEMLIRFLCVAHFLSRV